MTLRAIAAEMNTRAIGATPFQAGETAGRRLCMYGLLPGAAKAGRSLRGIRTGGTTPYNPLKGSAIAEAGGQALPEKWIQTPKGPVQVGAMKGAGAFGNVYGINGLPGRVIKIGNGTPNSADSFPRQVAGANLLERAGVPTPRIEPGPIQTPGGGPPMLFMQDIFNQWPGAQILKDLGSPTGAQLQAIQNLYNQIGRSGTIWVDGNPGNTFVYNGPRGAMAGVVDADMVFQEDALTQQPNLVQGNLANLLWSAGKGGLLFESPVSASRIMNALFQVRFGN